MDKKNILVTGGSGFIGLNLILELLKKTDYKIYNLDKLSYSSNNESLNKLIRSNGNKFSERYFFLNADLAEKVVVEDALRVSNPDLIIHLAAESHVDKSINNPEIFIKSNIFGTFNLLEESLNHYKNLKSYRREEFKFYHISTDEVFGSLNYNEKSFDENSKYNPRSPYSASKASSDHLVRTWNSTYKLPVLISHCSNNYGPWQFPEKLIPLIILKALSKQKIPIYGDGKIIRDWLHVYDHINAIMLIINQGIVGQSYCIGGSNEISNLNIANLICEFLDQILPAPNSYKELISFVDDRLGHDFRYSINSNFLKKSLGWEEKINFDKGLKSTVSWYVENIEWAKKIFNGYK